MKTFIKPILKAGLILTVFGLFSTDVVGQNNNQERPKVRKLVTSADKPSEATKAREAKATTVKKWSSNKQLPADFPKYVDTGNKEKDVEDYRKAKLKWINDNPERWKALMSKNN